MTLVAIHIIAGLLGLVSGAVALYARKGAKLHRQSGMIFVYFMLTMSASGAGMAVLNSLQVDAVAGVLTFYLVTTALLTVRPLTMKLYWINVGAMLVAFAVAITSAGLGIEQCHGRH